MFLTRFALRNPIPVTLFFGLIAVMGTVALLRMGRDILPPVALAQITVTAPYPGASASEIERLVIEPIEDELNGVAEVSRISATAQTGIGTIVAGFRFGSDIDRDRVNVQAAVDAARANLPADLLAPAVTQGDLSQIPIVDIAVSSALLDDMALSQTVEKQILPRLRATAGVGTIRVGGMQREQLAIVPKPGALDALGLTPLDLVAAVGGANIVAPGGTLRTSQTELGISVRSSPNSVATLAQMPVAAPGVTARLADVASVLREPAPQSTIARADGDHSVVLSMGRTRTADTISTIAQIRKTRAILAREYPLLRFTELRSDEAFTNAAIGGVLQTLLEGVALTVLVMLAFLRSWRGAVIAGIAIPASLLAAFWAMQTLGLTLNVLSLMGLSLTIGILVDDSIVIIEAISVAKMRGFRDQAAALAGRRELGGAAFAITLVDVAVFAPLAFMDGIVGEFMREFGLVVVIATAFSLLVAFTLTPLLAAHWQSREHTNGTARILPWMLRGPGFAEFSDRLRRAGAYAEILEQRAIGWYAGALLPSVLRRPKLILWSTGAMCALSLLPMFTGQIPTEFSPPLNRGITRLNVQLPAGTSLQATDARISALSSTLLEDPRVAHVSTTAGRASTGSGDLFASNVAQVDVVLTDASASFDLHPAVPGASVYGAGQGMGGAAPISYTIGGSAGSLDLAAARIATLLRQNPLAVDVRTSDVGVAPELAISVDPQRALLMNVSPAAVAQSARAASGGTIATKLRTDSGLVDVVVRGNLRTLGALQTLRRATVRTADGTRVPLESAARFRIEQQPIAIQREDGNRIVSVTANARDGAPIGRITTGLRPQLLAALPAGTSLQSRGDIEQFLNAVGAILRAILLSVALVYAILAVLYRSYRLPFIIMSTVPLACVGAFGALFIANALAGLFPSVAAFKNQTLNLYSMLGLLLLIGLVAKNGILLVEFAERGMRDGLEAASAMRQAAERRIRPIMMTTLAMICGMTPLAFGTTIGAEYRKALGTTVIGGLVSSLFLTLLVVPVIYTLARRAVPKKLAYRMEETRVPSATP